jgi:D-3-phosphoglycerate dehydrogenase
VRRIPQTHADLQAGTWRGDYYRFDSVGPELDGSTVGLVGFGAIGSRVARMLTGLGAHVLVADPFVTSEAVEGVADLVGLEELLARSAMVSLHARATPETRGLIGARELAAMPRGAVLVNCARGSLVDYDALCDALDSGHLFAAAVDVFPEEPLPPGSRLVDTPNLLMTPHLAGASRQTAVNAARMTAEEVDRWVGGRPLQFCANPEVFDEPRVAAPRPVR